VHVWTPDPLTEHKETPHAAPRDASVTGRGAGRPPLSTESDHSRVVGSESPSASTSAARIVPLGILLPDPTVFALDDEFGLLVFRQLSSALDGVGLAVMERVGTRGAVRLNRPATTRAGFDCDLRLSSHADPSIESGKAPGWHSTSGGCLTQVETAKCG